jgi:hypothetical protein
MSIKKANRLAEYCLKSKTPFLFVGHSGIGKTGVMRELAKRICPNHKFITIMASQQEVGDFIGLPNFKNIIVDDKSTEVTTWARPEWMPSEPAVIFLDELNNARQDVESAMLQLVYENRIHTHRLHPDSIVVAAINPATEEYTTANTMSAALVKRFVVIPFEPLPEEVIEWGEKTGKYDSEFIKFMGHDYNVTGVNKQLDTTIRLEPCPRMWEKISLTKALLDKDNPSDKEEILRDLITHSMGSEIAAKFFGWLETKEKPVTFADIIK